ncbi:hypothetical protein CMUS01_10294 [Colletotrichum musicola]|uniref:Uncharacterized protein n=1 Tax=Colletotrichum musicola TaxID=2175873 RepID=A0A8H6K4P8_9PEZI|nr:hypothetical protein CMUS01_10294 [Colletotrichum musicola]
MLCATFLLLTAAILGPAPVAAQSPTKTERSTVWLPPRSTRAGESNIYASVITAAPSSTEFLLACTSVWRSASACSGYSGLTLTYGDGTMKIGSGDETMDCKRGSTATCAVTSRGLASASSQAPRLVSDSESSSWFRAITIIDGHDKLAAAKGRLTLSSSSTTVGGPASAATSSTGGVCKRAVPKGGGGDGGSSSGGTTRPKGGDGDGCSGATGGFGMLPLALAGVAAVVGATFTVFL